ncbi:MAG: hypothetical protein JNK14_03860 [Chitinophagaceae bacterium]|nr:hypothetical protein [Chitinophagaceae bacterium]
MKTLRLTVLFLILPLAFYAQSLTGLWVGTVSNDSTTVRKDQSFEIVLTHYKDKVFGYSRSTFIVNDTLYYIVKRVKGTVEGDLCEVKDDDVVSHNFPHKPDKGVKMISTFRFDAQDSVWRMDGNWKTNQTKKFYSVSGKMNLTTEPDMEKSKIIPHLEELKMTEDIAVYQEAKKEKEKEALAANQIAERNKETVRKPVKQQPVMIAKESSKDPVTTAGIKPADAVIAKQTRADAKTETVIKETVKEFPASAEPVTVKQQPAADPPRRSLAVKEEKATAPVIKEVKKEEQAIAVKQETRPVETAVAKKLVDQQNGNNETATRAEVKKAETITMAADIKEKPVAVIQPAEVKPAVIQAATFIAERKVASQQTVYFKSDSLQLSLYDNGEVDGDTVSVLVNGELIIAKQGLKVSAIKKTIYAPAGKLDSLTLVLYAENLGKYPPNTGLLVVHDGEETYQVRFSADLQQNAAVIFRRKRN